MQGATKHGPRTEIRCDSCRRLVGEEIYADGGANVVLQAGAGYVDERCRVMATGWITTRSGCVPMREIPVACSDECERAILADSTWLAYPAALRRREERLLGR